MYHSLYIAYIQSGSSITLYNLINKTWNSQKTPFLTHLPKYCIYVSVNQVSIGSDNGLSPIPRQAII